MLELAEKEAEKHQTWHRGDPRIYQYTQDIEVVAISGNTYCITNSEGEELTSTISIANNIMIDVTDSYHVHKFFRMLLITELIRRELILLTSHAQNFQNLPSGTQGGEQFKPGRRRIVQRKWALPNNRHTFAEGSSTSSSHKASKRALKPHHQSQGVYQGATPIKQSRKNTHHKSKIFGTPAATQQAIPHANFNPHAILIRQFTQKNGGYTGHIFDIARMYKNISKRGSGETKLTTT